MKNLKQKKNVKIKPKNRIKINIPVVITGTVFVVVMLISLYFSNHFSVLLKLQPKTNNIPKNSLEVHYVNVGQGDSILIKFPNSDTMIIDSGPVSSKSSLMFYIENVFFKNNDSKKFTYAVLTHSDSDHSGNMLNIIEKFGVKNFYRPSIYVNGLDDKHIDNVSKISNVQEYVNLVAKIYELETENLINVEFNSSDILFENEFYNFNFLTPNKETYSSTNDFSPIILMESLNYKFLFTGDASKAIEKEAINNYLGSAEDLKIDVLKVGHHGSNTSTSEILLETFNPNYAVISVSENNSYSHPHVDVYDEILNYSLKNDLDLKNNILTTANDGNIVFHAKQNDSLKIITIKNSQDYLFVSYQTVISVWVFVLVIFTVVKGIKFKSLKATNL